MTIREDAPALRALVDLTWAAMQPYPKIWPPIIAGDFNGDPELLPVSTRSPQGLNGSIDDVLIGKPEAFPSTYSPLEAETERTPRDTPPAIITPRGPIHCGIDRLAVV